MNENDNRNPAELDRASDFDRAKRKKIHKIVLLSLAAAAAIAVCVLLFPYFLSLRDASVRNALFEKLRSLGVWGILLALLLQIVQVIFAVIPGEPIELLMGMLYGTWGGLLLCLLGSVIGSVLIFLTIRAAGKETIDRMLHSEKYQKLHFLSDSAKRDVFVFILFLIPGTPKDLLTYFAPCTGISLLRFLILSTVARIPSVVSSTYIGANLAEGNLLKGLIILALTGVIGLAGIWVNNRFLAKRNKPEKPDCATENTPEEDTDD